MKVAEAEIQVLASLMKAEIEATPTDRTSIVASGECYWIFLEDWSDAFQGLMAKELITGDDDGYHLTVSGRPLADAYRKERPDMYWYYYQKFYPAARASVAHSRLCERVFGEDLCQEGQTDMAALGHLLELLDLKEDNHVLDLGCGAGVIAEYISDQTGASVTGLDYAVTAIDEATERTASKRSRLTFLPGDMNELDLLEGSFDAAISLDTLYWVADLEITLSKVSGALRPGGKMGLFMNHHIKDGDKSDMLEAKHSELSRALQNLGLSFETHGYTRQIGEFWHRIWEAAKELREEFEQEGNGYIAASLMRESEVEYLPDVTGGKIARYLYLVRC